MPKNLEVTILGCGSSGGVPRVGGDWGACDPANPKNRRTRCSILVEYWEGEGACPRHERTAVLVDTSPDLREQLLRADVKHLDGVLFTHEHADQTHGIDDLRAIAYRMRQKIPVYTNSYTKKFLFERFGYCFVIPEGRVHPTILEDMPDISADAPLIISGPGGDLMIDVLEMSHGVTPVLGFRFAGEVVYTPDVHEIDNDDLDRIQNSAVWIMDALRYNQSPAHAHTDKSLQWSARTKPSLTVMTNMHLDLDYDIFSTELLDGQHAAYDGMKLFIICP